MGKDDICSFKLSHETIVVLVFLYGKRRVYRIKALAWVAASHVLISNTFWQHRLNLAVYRYYNLMLNSYIFVISAIMLRCIVYMSVDNRLWNIIPLKPSETESKILNSLIELDVGNTYQIWKQSCLLNYPTVLRAIKKLVDRKMVRILDRSNNRGEVVYTSTLQGTLLFYLFNNDKENAILLAKNESALFKTLKGSKIELTVLFAAASKFILESQENDDASFKKSLEEAIVDRIGDYVFEFIHNSQDEYEEVLIDLSNNLELRKIIVESINIERQGLQDMILRSQTLQTKIRKNS